ncbi:MAG: hypothetical protein WAX04_10210 [Oscillospiraceae bacterium]
MATKKQDVSDMLATVKNSNVSTVTLAMTHSLNPDERKSFVFLLGKITESLEPPKRKMSRRKKAELVPALDIFHDEVIPQIEKSLIEYDRKEIAWRFDLNFQDFFGLTLIEMKKEHEKIVQQETVVANFDLLVKFHRGMIYLVAHSMITEENKRSNIKEWFQEEFDVSYNTALKYMNFSTLIKTYPKLMICNISFDKLMANRTKLIQYFSTEKGHVLRDALSTEVGLHIQGVRSHKVGITKSDLPMLLEDPEDSNIDATDFHQSFFEHWDEGDLPSILYPPKQECEESMRALNLNASDRPTPRNHREAVMNVPRSNITSPRNHREAVMNVPRHNITSPRSVNRNRNSRMAASFPGMQTFSPRN